MERDQIIAAAFAVVVLLAIVFVAVSMSGQDGGAVTPVRRFEARPGTTREGASPFFSARGFRVEGSETGDISLEGDSENADGEMYPEAEPVEEAPKSETARRVTGIELIQDPWDRLERLTALLTTQLDAADRARVYGAMGAAYLQAGPEHETEAYEAFANARDAAGVAGESIRAETLLAEVTALRAAGKHEELLDRIEASELAPECNPAIQVWLVAAQTYEQMGRTADAEAAYERLVRRFETPGADIRPEAEALYRLTCLGLSRLYRATDRQQEADAVYLGMQRRLNQDS